MLMNLWMIRVLFSYRSDNKADSAGSQPQSGKAVSNRVGAAISTAPQTKVSNSLLQSTDTCRFLDTRCLKLILFEETVKTRPRGEKQI